MRSAVFFSESDNWRVRAFASISWVWRWREEISFRKRWRSAADSTGRMRRRDVGGGGGPAGVVCAVVCCGGWGLGGAARCGLAVWLGGAAGGDSGLTTVNASVWIGCGL